MGEKFKSLSRGEVFGNLRKNIHETQALFLDPRFYKINKICLNLPIKKSRKLLPDKTVLNYFEIDFAVNQKNEGRGELIIEVTGAGTLSMWLEVRIGAVKTWNFPKNEEFRYTRTSTKKLLIGYPLISKNNIEKITEILLNECNRIALSFL
jgi:hypothetical protein